MGSQGKLSSISVLFCFRDEDVDVFFTHEFEGDTAQYERVVNVDFSGFHYEGMEHIVWSLIGSEKCPVSEYTKEHAICFEGKRFFSDLIRAGMLLNDDECIDDIRDEIVELGDYEEDIKMISRFFDDVNQEMDFYDFLIRAGMKYSE